MRYFNFHFKVLILILVYCISEVFGKDHTHLVFPKQSSPDTPLDAVWQPVFGTQRKLYVYSAYADKRESNFITVIAMTAFVSVDKVICRIWMMNNKNFTVLGIIQKMHELPHGMRLTGAFVKCLLNNTGTSAEQTVESSVSIVSAVYPSRPYTNRIIIKNIEPDPDTLDHIYICVQPIHSNYNRAEWIVEWLEFNKLLGVKKIYLYKESVGTQVDCILKEYEKNDFISYLNWTLPRHVQKNIWSFGQTTALNECLYRTMSQTGWMLNIDFDELVVPTKSVNFQQLLLELGSILKKDNNTDLDKIGEIHFKNIFFYLGWADHPKAPYDLITLRKTRRSQFPYLKRYRNKYMVRPFNVFHLGIHQTWEFVQNTVSINSSEEAAVLHHYRMSCVEETSENCLQLPSSIDKTAQRWSDQLIKNFRKQRKVLEKQCLQGYTNHEEINNKLDDAYVTNINK